jgi:type I restriction enzyme, S subunit
MSEWQETKLGNVIELKRGYDLPQSQRTYGNVPIVSSSGVSDFHNKAMVKAPGVVTGRYGTIGQVFYIEKDFWPLNTALYVRDFKTNDPKFINYLLKTLDFRAYSDKAAVPGVNRNHLHEAKVRIPPLPIQHAIAHILGSLDDKIELNRRMNETLEAMARALFKDWFVEFGPVRAKMEGRQPPGLSAEIAALFPDALDAEDKPVGWEIKRVDDVLELVYGKALRAVNRVPGEIPVYGSGGIIEYHNEFLVNGPSIIVGRKGTVGSLYWEDRPFFPIDTVFYVKPKTPLTFCFYLLQSLGLEGMNTDAAVPGLNRSNVYRLSVTCASDDILLNFDNIIQPLRKQIFFNARESRTLAALRDLLLPKLLSGELRVRVAEEIVEGAR